ncbi:MAG TPA: glutamyl-tRNA reductase [Bacteroidia bacterium]
MKLSHFYIVAATHKKFSLSEVGQLHLDDASVKDVLTQLKTELGLEELVYLSTCNRVEFLFTTKKAVNKSFLNQLFALLNSQLKKAEIKKLVTSSQLFTGNEAVNHILRVASSLDSLVVGEREIITQFRLAYEKCHGYGITSDFMRLLNKHTIETAKQIFTETDIAKNPVSVMSLAYRILKEKEVKENSRCVFVGAGQTNAIMAKYLKKHNFSSFAVFNRSLPKAQLLAAELGAEAFDINQLKSYTKGFDVLITCTGSSTNLITPEIYEQLLQNDSDKKIIIDLAVPVDVHPDVLKKFNIDYISVSEIKRKAKKNVGLRRKEIKICEAVIAKRVIEFQDLIQERTIELAFGEIPLKIREINNLALTEVFAKDVNTLDEGCKQTIEKIMNYLEKKYNAVAITTAKKVFLQER